MSDLLHIGEQLFVIRLVKILPSNTDTLLFISSAMVGVYDFMLDLPQHDNI